MLQNKHQIPVNVPTPPVGYTTLFPNQSDMGAFYAKFSDGSINKLGSGGGGQVILTLSELVGLIDNEQLSPETVYFISNRGVYMRAATTSLFYPTAFRAYSCPATYQETVVNGIQLRGIYDEQIHQVGGYNIDDIVIWGAKPWKIIGNYSPFISVDSPYYLPDEYGEEINYGHPLTNDVYVIKTFMCGYDVINDWEEWREDDKGNRVGVNYVTAQEMEIDYNPCQKTDWNRDDVHVFVGNKSPFGLTNIKCMGSDLRAIYSNVFTGSVNNIYLTDGVLAFNELNDLERIRAAAVVRQKGHNAKDWNVVEQCLNNIIESVENLVCNSFTDNHFMENSGDITLNGVSGSGDLTGNRVAYIRNCQTQTEITNNNFCHEIENNENTGAIHNNTSSGGIINLPSNLVHYANHTDDESHYFEWAGNLPADGTPIYPGDCFLNACIIHEIVMEVVSADVVAGEVRLYADDGVVVSSITDAITWDAMDTLPKVYLNKTSTISTGAYSRYRLVNTGGVSDVEVTIRVSAKHL